MNICYNCDSLTNCFSDDIPCVDLQCAKLIKVYFCSTKCKDEFDKFCCDGSITCDKHEDLAHF